jgi:hypothetical protein
MRQRTAIAAAVGATALLAAGATLALAAPGPPEGDPAGIALARLSNASYAKPALLGVQLHTPASSIGGSMVRLILKRGRLHAGVGVFAFGPVRFEVVKTPAGRFERLPSERCWRRSTDQEAGAPPRIEVRGSRFFAPQPIGKLVRLEVNEWNPAAGARIRTAYKIDPLTGRIASFTIDGETTNMRVLDTLPKIPRTKPMCTTPPGG